MMKFDYLKPKTIKKAMLLLEQHGDRAHVLAGGTDLIARMKDGKIKADYIINLGCIPGLNVIKKGSEGITIGALTTISTLENNGLLGSEYSAVAECAHQMASPGIRNMATVGGSLCSASPSGDMAPALMLYDARVLIQCLAGKREMPLSELFSGPWKTVLSAGEILLSIYLHKPQSGTGSAYLKYAARENDLAIVGAGASLTMENGICKKARITLGAVAPTPIRALRTESFLHGKKIGKAEIAEAGKIAASEANPRRGSVRADPEYRRDMVSVFMRRAIALALERAGGSNA